MEFRPEDVRVEGFRAGFESSWSRATHLPTGISVTVEGEEARGPAGHMRLIAALREAVEKHEQ